MLLPRGSYAQLIFGLMICFLSFGGYMFYQPYKTPPDNLAACFAQVNLSSLLLARRHRLHPTL